MSVLKSDDSNDFKTRIKTGLKITFELLKENIKKPKVILILLLIWYIETPLVILAEKGISHVSLFELYINPFKLIFDFISSISVIFGFLKLNFFLFMVFVIICVVLHLSGHETEKILDLNKIKVLGDMIQKEEGQFKISDRGDYGTAKWADEKFIDKMNRESVASKSQPYIEITKEGKNGLLYGYFENTKKVVTLPKKTTLNRNFAVFGSSGSMKSRSFVIPNILNLIENEESIFVTDPKGELLAKTYDVLVKNGYNVKSFNINNIPCSDRWNVLEEIRDEQTASIFAKSIIDNTKGAGEKGDPFWDNHYVNFLKAIALYVRFNEPKERRNMATVYEYITYPAGFVGLDELIGNAIKENPNHPAAQSWITFVTAAGNEKVSSGVMSGLAIKLDTLQIPSFRDLLSGNDIDLTAPGRQKAAYFVVVPDTHGTFNFLAGLFFTFAFINLIDFADKLGDALPYQVNFLLDEFPNIAKIPDIEKKISTVRSRGVSICVIFQALSQLASRYSPEVAEEILANCDNKIFLGANEMTTSKYISEMLGDATIEVETEMQETFRVIPSRKSKGLAKRSLMTPDEVLKKPKKNSILLLTGMRPIKATKMDYTQHRNGKEIQEHNIYDMLKPWSRKYHKHYLDEMCKQLRKAINKDLSDDIINLDKMERELSEKEYEAINGVGTFSGRSEEDILNEVRIRAVTAPKDENDLSKMERTLLILEEKLRILEEEDEKAAAEKALILEKLPIEIKNAESIEELNSINDKIFKLKSTSNNDEEKILNSILEFIEPKKQELLESILANDVKEITSSLSKLKLNYSSINDFDELKYFLLNADLCKFKDSQKNIIFGDIEEIFNTAFKSIDSLLKKKEFDLANKFINILRDIFESDVINDFKKITVVSKAGSKSLSEKVKKVEAKLNDIEDSYNKLSEETWEASKDLEEKDNNAITEIKYNDYDDSIENGGPINSSEDSIENDVIDESNFENLMENNFNNTEINSVDEMFDEFSSEEKEDYKDEIEGCKEEDLKENLRISDSNIEINTKKSKNEIKEHNRINLDEKKAEVIYNKDKKIRDENNSIEEQTSAESCW